MIHTDSIFFNFLLAFIDPIDGFRQAVIQFVIKNRKEDPASLGMVSLGSVWP